MKKQYFILLTTWLLIMAFEKAENEKKLCDPWSGYCFTNSCIMDFAQNYGYFVVWVDCGMNRYRYEASGCIGPSMYDYCTSPIFSEN